MSTVAEVKLWGRTIGAVALEEEAQTASFEYDPVFLLFFVSTNQLSDLSTASIVVIFSIATEWCGGVSFCRFDLSSDPLEKQQRLC